MRGERREGKARQWQESAGSGKPEKEYRGEERRNRKIKYKNKSKSHKGSTENGGNRKKN